MPKALIIDDNTFNVSILARYLEEEGLESVTITHPKLVESALNTLEDVSIVFLDLEMPNIDGFDVLKTLRADSRLSSIPIIAHTVHVSEISAAHSAGFDGFIGKPLNADRFPGQLGRILEGKAVWETA